MKNKEFCTWHFGPNVKARNLGYEERFLLSQFKGFAKEHLKQLFGNNKISDRTVVAPLIDFSLMFLIQHNPELAKEKSYTYLKQFVDNYKKGHTNEHQAKDLGLKFKNNRKKPN